MTLDLRMLLPSLALISLIGCESRGRTISVPRSIDPEQASVKEIREQTAINGILAGAEAGQITIVKVQSHPTRSVQTSVPGSPVPPVPPVPPIPGFVQPSNKIIHFQSDAKTTDVSTGRSGVQVWSRASATVPQRKPTIQLLKVRSEKPHPTEQAALTDALSVARIEVIKKLQQLNPPISTFPSMVSMRNEYLKRHERITPSEELKNEWLASGLNSNRVWVEVDVELTEADLQRYRSEERVDMGLAIASILFVIALAAHGFLRLDAWTKGYLTLWLGFASIGLVVLAILFVVA